MKYIFLFSFLLSFIADSFTQNLVYNPDFEIYDTCPSNISHPLLLQVERATGWVTPRKQATSDFFHVCNNLINGQAGVPSNGIGYQYPNNGNGYTGFYTFTLDPDFNIYREYIQTELISPLESGKAYYLGFYVSWYGYNYAMEKIGALFSFENYRDSSYTPIVAQAQIVNNNGPIIDSIGWTLIEGVFIANGNERFLTFGYFEDTLNFSDTLDPYGIEFISMESYYFLDGISCIEIEPDFPNVFTPNNDGLNDSFYPTVHYFIWDRFTIFNRWGSIVFDVENNFIPWQGKNNNGNECPEGTYFYQIKKGKYTYKGHITLLR